MKAEGFAILMDNIANPGSRTGKCLPVHTGGIKQTMNFAVVLCLTA